MSLTRPISGFAPLTSSQLPLHGAETFAPANPGFAKEKIVPSLRGQLGQGLSVDARLYVLRQLMLRATVSQEMLNPWQVEVNDDDTVVTLARDARIRFRHAPATFWSDLGN